MGGVRAQGRAADRSQVKDSITITLRHYFSRIHRDAARIMGGEAAKIEASYDAAQYTAVYATHRAYVINAVLDAVASLEAAINELYADAAEQKVGERKGLPTDLILRLAQAWKVVYASGLGSSGPILEKYELALILAGSVEYQKGASPYQDVAAVVKLRNALVHSVPQDVMAYSDSEGVRTLHKFESLLAHRFEANPITGPGNPYYPDKLLGHGCAAWAIESVERFVSDFHSRLGTPSPFG